MPRCFTHAVAVVVQIRSASEHLHARSIHVCSPARPQWLHNSMDGSASGKHPLPSLSLGEFRDLPIDGVHYTPANGPQFREVLTTVQPDVVFFDRVSSEEMHGWQVADVCPHAVTVLDTQDVHFLRHAREAVIQSGGTVQEAAAALVPPLWLQSDLPSSSSSDSSNSSSPSVDPDATARANALVARVGERRLLQLQEHLFRELGSILRADVTVVVSDVEASMLKDCYGVNPTALVLGSLFHPLPPTPSALPAYADRSGFCMIGHWRHKPNGDAAR
jgi:hypothetical protein